MKTYFFTCLVTLLSASYGLAQTDVQSELTKDEIKLVTAREFVIKTRELQGLAWPEVTFYTTINFLTTLSVSNTGFWVINVPAVRNGVTRIPGF